MCFRNPFAINLPLSMTHRWLLYFASLLSATGLLAQEKPPASAEEYEKAFEWRVRQEVLNGVYIPEDLGDAFAQFNRLIDKESKQRFKNVPEEIAARKLHFSLGRWIIHNWGFYGGSRLSAYLQDIGLSYPDDMARLLIITYHRYLNKKDLDVKNLVTHFQEMRRQEYLEEIQEGEILHEETRQRPRPDSTTTKGNGKP